MATTIIDNPLNIMAVSFSQPQTVAPLGATALLDASLFVEPLVDIEISPMLQNTRIATMTPADAFFYDMLFAVALLIELDTRPMNEENEESAEWGESDGGPMTLDELSSASVLFAASRE